MHRIRKKSDTLPPFKSRIAPIIMTTTEFCNKRAAEFAERMNFWISVYSDRIKEIETIVEPIIKEFNGKKLSKRLETAIKAAQSENSCVRIYLTTDYHTAYLHAYLSKSYTDSSNVISYAQAEESLIEIITDSENRIDAEKTLAYWKVTKLCYIAKCEQWKSDIQNYHEAQQMAEKIDNLIGEYSDKYSYELRKEFFLKNSLYIK